MAPDPTGRGPRWWRHRLLSSRWRRVGAGVALCVLLALLALHTPWARQAVLSWTLSYLRESTGLRVEAGQLDYNLLTLEAGVRNLTVSAVGHDRPFLQSEAVRLNLPWSIALGVLHVQSIEIDRPRFDILRDERGTLNLPAAAAPAEPEKGAPAPEPPGAVRVDRLAIRDLGAAYADNTRRLSVDGRGLALGLQRDAKGLLTGRLSMRDGLTVRLDDRVTTVSRLEAGVGFDGSALTVDEFALEAPEGALRLDGRVGLLAGDARLDGRYAGSLDVARLAPWLGIAPVPAGALAFSGTLAGSLDAPDVTIELTSQRLAWSQLGDLSLELRASASVAAARLESFRARLAGGEVTATAQLQLDEDGPSQLRLRWSDLDVGLLAEALADMPLRVGSAASGEASLDWPGSNVMAARGRVRAQLKPSRRGGALPLAGSVELNLDAAGRYQLAVEQQVAEAVAVRARVDGRLAADDPSASSLDGRADVRLMNARQTLRLLQAAGVALDPTMVETVGGAVTTTATLGGTLAAPTARGAVEASGLRFGDIGPGRARAHFGASTSEVAVDGLRVEVGPNFVTGRLNVGLADSTLAGAIEGELPQIAILSGAIPASWRPEGAARFEAALGGTFDNPSLAFRLSSNDLRVAGQVVAGLDARLELANRILTVDRLDIEQTEGRLSATARYALDGGQYRFGVAGDDLVIVPVGSAEAPDGRVPLDARFDLRLSGEGTATRPRARGFVQFSRLDWGAYALGPARAEVTVEPGTVLVKGNVPALGALLDASLALDTPRRFTADASISEAKLSDLVRPSGPAGTPDRGETSPLGPGVLAGAVTVRAAASGDLDDLAGSTVDLDLRLIDVSINGAQVRLERPARLRYARQEIEAQDLDLWIGGARLSARGRLGTAAGGEPLEATLTGSLADFVPLVRLVPGLDELEAAGALDVRTRVQGTIESPDISGELSITGASLASGSLPPVDDIALRMTLSRGLIDLGEFRGTWQGATASASGQVPVPLLGAGLPEGYVRSLPDLPDRARATVQVVSLTDAALSPFVDPTTLDRLAGRFDVSATIEADALALDAVRAEVTLERAELDLARVSLAQTSPSRLHLADGRLDVVEWRWSGAGNQLDLGGQVVLTTEPPALDLRVAGAVDLRVLEAFAPDVAMAGRARLDLTARGAATAPRIDGTLAIEDGDVAVREPRFAVTDLQGSVTFSDGRLRVRDLTGAANGGTLTVAGELQLADVARIEGTLTASGRGLAFEIPENLRSEVDADLALTLSQAAPSLTGRVTILRGSYREPISLAGQLLTGVEVRASVPEETEPGPLDQVTLSIAVVSEENLLVDNNYGRLELSSNLRVVGTLAKPALAGRLTVREGGQIFLGGQTYDVRRATVDFTSATGIEPDIDLVLDTRVQRYDITLEVRGTPETIEAQLRSPGLSQEDVVSLLLTGQLAEDTTVPQTEVARGQLLMLLSGELLGFAGRAVGLDSVQVSRGLGGSASDFDLLITEADPSARLTIAKHLSRDVEVVFSQSLRESGDITWIAIYRPLRNLELRSTTQDDNSRAYEFRHEVNFGGGAGLPPAARPRARAPRVSDVRITGDPGFEDRELRARLDLEPGDRFEFDRWQRDQDRLLAFYHDRDYLEARVSARRQAVEGDAGGPALALIYEIDRGPVAELAIEGHSLPNGVVSRMRRAWERAVFDGFLLEDLTAMARQALAEQHYLQAVVDAKVVSAPGDAVKRIVVQLAPGTRFDDRRITFSGNERLSADALQAVVRSRGLMVTAWLEPDALRTALARHYRSLGYLAADAIVDAPIFGGQAALLPVRVSEGRPFQIDAVHIQGVSARAEADVRRAFGITDQMPYLPGAIEPARRAVEIGYLREGFNRVRVTVTTVVDQERSCVDVSLSVDEGSQQVLEAVDVQGAEITSTGVVNRVLAMTPGQPANVTDYYRAQKRLYDTGVFQSADIELEPVATAADTGRVQPVRAKVTLRELPSYRLRYGVRLSDEAGPVEATREVRPGLVVDLLRRNLFGQAIAAGVAGQIQGDRRLARGLISLPVLGGLPVTTNFFLTASRTEFTPAGAARFVEDETGVSAEQRFRPSRRMFVSYGYTFAHKRRFEPDPLPGPPSIPQELNVAHLTGTYAWDTRDDPSNARRGWLHSSGLELGSRALGSEVRFVKYLTQQYFFAPLGADVVLASGFRLGAGRGFGQDLIPSEKFYAGGGTSVRGFAEDGLGGPVGGNALLLLNEELRFPIFKWVHGVSFLDVGNVFASASDLSLTNLEAGAGFGLRIYSPFVLVRIDYGIPLTRRAREPFGRWYFGIGHTF